MQFVETDWRENFVEAETSLGRKFCRLEADQEALNEK